MPSTEDGHAAGATEGKVDLFYCLRAAVSRMGDGSLPTALPGREPGDVAGSASATVLGPIASIRRTQRSTSTSISRHNRLNM